MKGMKKQIFVGLCIAVSFLNAQERSLVWSEEFNAPSLNRSLWTISEGDGCPNLCGWGNN